MSTPTRKTPRFAAVAYPPRSRSIGFLAAFAERLRADGVRVAGLVQEGVEDADGAFRGIDAVDVATGARVAIKRVTARNRDTNVCALDTQALAANSGVLRRAVAARAELIVFDKFGVEEQRGKGLSDEIMAAIAEGIPLLISVPEPALDIWQERTGGLGAVLPLDPKALDDWWAAVG